MEQLKSSYQIDAIKNRHSDALQSIPGVIGLGVGSAEHGPVIQIHITNDDPGLAHQLPNELDGIPTEIVTHSGTFSAF